MDDTGGWDKGDAEMEWKVSESGDGWYGDWSDVASNADSRTWILADIGPERYHRRRTKSMDGRHRPDF